MSTQHTPGPWICAGPSFGDTLPRYTNVIMTDWEHEDDGYIEICELPFNYHDDENEANACLIAAAPDLLSALNAMLTHMGMDEDEWNKPTFDQARAAIVKATGAA